MLPPGVFFRRAAVPALQTAVLLMLVSGCGLFRSTPATPPVVGTWAYVVANTPQGDAPGTLVVTYVDGHLGGRMVVDLLGQTAPLEKASFENNVFTFVATVNIDGQATPVRGEATVEGDTMSGRVEVPGIGTFVLTATRQALAGG
ncbi:MAG: hypothetical protein KatS3mg043_2055 [Rhodothermaceae bacterium]|nr:MAG: hypothetical protein KatS3mg043_2055 [Rhodothermaceae bacterium]